MSQTLEYLVVEDRPPAAFITLNRPQTLNALSTGLMTELTSELERQAARREVRAIVLKGAGRAVRPRHRQRRLPFRHLGRQVRPFLLHSWRRRSPQRQPQAFLGDAADWPFRRC